MHNKFLSLVKPLSMATFPCSSTVRQGHHRSHRIGLMMMYLRYTRPIQGRQPTSSSGFTLLEVMVAIMVLSMFISIAMAGLSLSMLLKVRARISTEATNWIQQDLEVVRSQAARLNYTLASNALAGQNALILTSTTGLAVNEQITIGRSVTAYTITRINGNTVELNTNLPGTQTAGTTVFNVSKCNATTAQAGYAAIVQQNLPPLTDGGSRTIAGKTFTLTRNVAVRTTAPFEVLQMTYSVQGAGATVPITSMYTEVIPNVAFQCART